MEGRNQDLTFREATVRAMRESYEDCYVCDLGARVCRTNNEEAHRLGLEKARQAFYQWMEREDMLMAWKNCGNLTSKFRHTLGIVCPEKPAEIPTRPVSTTMSPSPTVAPTAPARLGAEASTAGLDGKEETWGL